jgi:putative selenate reductase
MSDKFSVIPFNELFRLIIDQIERKKSFFGIPEEIFYKSGNQRLNLERFGYLLETPVGIAAGPQTQLAQNIAAAWLCGARYIELKTIQTLDELSIPKPCIDMQDEGYNCEWSQELKINQSFDQYLNAWIIIHVLKDRFGIGKHSELGTIFNMSIGYDLRGIMQDNVQWFLSRMQNCKAEKTEKIREIVDFYPRINEILIPDRISDNVTLSTMHGCPPDEIEKIGLYLITQQKLHTIVKLNPTLLGKQKLNRILRNSGFDTVVDDSAFDHDLQYPEAIKIIRNLQKAAADTGVQFGLKLTNTLECLNHKKVFQPGEKTMYLSGRPLHPIAVNLAAKLQNDFDGRLDISFSAGANAYNVAKVIRSGLTPVTVCSDLLKPGGYGLLRQYLTSIEWALNTWGFSSAREMSDSKSALGNLNRYADEVLEDKTYQKTEIHSPDIKSYRTLGFFDCISAPCMDACATHQDIPDYLHYTSSGDFKSAYETILRTNPFPNTTGMICDQLCQNKCTRINYDNPLMVREVKRFVAKNYHDRERLNIPETKGLNAAIIGGGPSGLSCACFLALAGFSVEVFEAKDQPGGMVSAAIPSFRLPDEYFLKDVERIENLGIKIHYGLIVDKEKFRQIRKDFQYIYIAAGAQLSRFPEIEGLRSKGVLDPLKFLFGIKNGKVNKVGKNIVVIGGGNTAMDVARTAWRLSSPDGKVTLIYRRTKREMPADNGEIRAVMREGIKILELVQPVKVNSAGDSVKSLTCVRVKLGKPDESGRATPELIPGSEFEVDCDCVIPAVGQDLNIDFVDKKLLATNEGDFETGIPGVFIGGDALRGASTAINAIGDGRKAAEKILEKAQLRFKLKLPERRQKQDLRSLMNRRMQKIPAIKLPETDSSLWRTFEFSNCSLSETQAKEEASRCLACDEVCNICVTVCPNLANYSYTVEPEILQLKKISAPRDRVIEEYDQEFVISQPYQILHIADWCNQCGNCSTFCPTASAPYHDKPHLYLTKEGFESADKGFYYEVEKGVLFFRENQEVHELVEEKDEYVYHFKGSLVRIDKAAFNIRGYRLSEKVNELRLNKAVLMKFILEGIRDFSGKK